MVCIISLPINDTFVLSLWLQTTTTSWTRLTYPDTFTSDKLCSQQNHRHPSGLIAGFSLENCLSSQTEAIWVGVLLERWRDITLGSNRLLHWLQLPFQWLAKSGCKQVVADWKRRHFAFCTGCTSKLVKYTRIITYASVKFEWARRLVHFASRNDWILEWRCARSIKFIPRHSLLHTQVPFINHDIVQDDLSSSMQVLMIKSTGVV